MGDKSPKSISKNRKQKDTEKSKADKKAQEQVDAKKQTPFPLKRAK